MREIGTQKSLEYNEFTFKKIEGGCTLGDGIPKKGNTQSHMHEISEKKTAYNEGRLYRTAFETYIYHNSNNNSNINKKATPFRITIWS